MGGSGVRSGILAVAALASLLAIACGETGPRPAGPIAVVAGESFWGSLAAQLGGSKAAVQSVVSDPNADPHEYESSAADARAFADAGLVILNGAGYDDWGRRLLDANPASGRKVLSVADLLGRKAGDNPHFWYDPTAVTRVADAITSAYESLDPADAALFEQNRIHLTEALQPYRAEIEAIRERYSGAQVGSTESVFVYMASALGLDLITPVAFMNAVAEGNDPPVGAVITFQDQIATRQIRVLVYNTQTTTLVTTNLRTAAESRHIPTVGISETIQPADLTFQDWQLKQLKALELALSASL